MSTLGDLILTRYLDERARMESQVLTDYHYVRDRYQSIKFAAHEPCGNVISPDNCVTCHRFRAADEMMRFLEHTDETLRRLGLAVLEKQRADKITLQKCRQARAKAQVPETKKGDTKDADKSKGAFTFGATSGMRTSNANFTCKSLHNLPPPKCFLKPS